MNLLYSVAIFLHFLPDTKSLLFGVGPLGNIFNCMWKKSYSCPHEDIKFHLYTPTFRHGIVVDITRPRTFKKYGFHTVQDTAIIIHGFNGTENSRPMMFLKDAYIARKYNVITVDWYPLANYPCYLSSLSNTKLVAQCTAQLYAFITHLGCKSKQITCVGHSLGAHICGMVSNHLTTKQYKIIGLDPARPLIEQHADHHFRLTRDDARVVQVIHTNAGFLGQQSMSGSVDFCINGGAHQPYCKSGNPIRRARCSHFLSICYVANAMLKKKQLLGAPCPNGCTRNHGLPLSYKPKPFFFGQDTPESLRGTYCLQETEHAKNCPFN